MRTTSGIKGAALLLAVTLAAAAAGSTITVPIDQPTIGLGLDHAAPGDSVLVMPGTYEEYGLTIRAGVHLLGQGPGPESTVIDAQGQGRVLHVSGGDTRVQNLRLMLGAAHHGGGIHVDAGEIILQDLEIVSCVAENGGAVYVDGASVQMLDCALLSNLGRSTGGGLHAVDAPAAVVDGCLFHLNETYGMGGAWYAALSDLEIRHTTLVNNVAPLGAEGAAFGDDAVVVDLTVATDNQSAEGWSGLTTTLFTDAPSHLENSCTLRWLAGAELWSGYLAPQLADPSLGNQELDPLFCGGDGELHEVFGLAANSPALPQDDGCGLKGAYGEACGPVGAPDVAVSADRLHPASPNPFNPSTTLHFDVARAGPVKVVIYGLDGRRVATLVDEAREAGRHQATWSGLDDRGRPVASGVYLARLVTTQSQHAIRLTLVK